MPHVIIDRLKEINYPVKIDDTFYHDIFLLEGLASSQIYGIQQLQEMDPDHTDYWILNTSRYPVDVKSHSGYTLPTHIDGNSLTLIKTSSAHDYADGDIYFEYQGRTQTVIPIQHNRQ